MIRKLLIANRGEIACRVIGTARRMGMRTVAICSDADRDALHVRMADQAIRVGPAPAIESYLSIGSVIAAAREAGADAIHPGYGFLSENVRFAQVCGEAGITFVGPPADAIEAMGDKARARRIALDAGVSVVPGYDGDDQTPETLAREARRLGVPLLIKAVAGGGGRGMRKVLRHEHFGAALDGARREAVGAFGDGRVLLERLVENGRHIEVQVFGDSFGNLLHLGERDCSAQRRHQKIIEEAPSPFVDDALRERLASEALRLARAVNYVGAGTVEFIVAQDGTHFFLEMNTRLQVEHPVTELVTGLDLVEWQLRVASGEALPMAQHEIRRSGHAIEARLYAEDPAAGFRPQTGTILRWRPCDAGTRVDSGYAEGDTMTPHYDPMIAKFVARGEDRDDALGQLRGSLLATPLFGFATNRAFLLDLLASGSFGAGAVTTGLVDTMQEEGRGPFAPVAMDRLAWAVAGVVLATKEGGDWFRSTGLARFPITLAVDGVRKDVSIVFERGELAGAEVDGETFELAAFALGADTARWRFQGRPHSARWLASDGGLWLDFEGRTYLFVEPDLLAPRAQPDDPSRIVSPLAGVLRAVLVAEGDRVAAGQPVMVVEAMKMETVLKAGAAATIVSLAAAPGGQVVQGALLATLKIEPPDA